MPTPLLCPRSPFNMQQCRAAGAIGCVVAEDTEFRSRYCRHVFYLQPRLHFSVGLTAVSILAVNSMFLLDCNICHMINEHKRKNDNIVSNQTLTATHKTNADVCVVVATSVTLKFRCKFCLLIPQFSIFTLRNPIVQLTDRLSIDRFMWRY